MTDAFRILAINVGSSSVKFGVYDLVLDQPCLESHIDQPESIAQALNGIQRKLEEAGIGKIDAIGHRIAHGGGAYAAPVRIDVEVEQAIERCIPLAPQHNPAIWRAYAWPLNGGPPCPRWRYSTRRFIARCRRRPAPTRFRRLGAMQG